MELLHCQPHPLSGYWSFSIGWSECFNIFQDITESLGSDQEDWSSFTSVDEKLNHVQTTDLKASSYSPANNAAILKLYKESELADDIHIMQSSAESVQSFSDLFSNNEMVSIHCILSYPWIKLYFSFDVH